MKNSMIEFHQTKPSGEYSLYDGEKEIKSVLTNQFEINEGIVENLLTNKMPNCVILIQTRQVEGISFKITIRKLKGTKFSVSVYFSDQIIKGMPATDYYNTFMDAVSLKGYVKIIVPLEGIERPIGVAFHFRASTIKAIADECDRIVRGLYQELQQVSR